MIHSFLLIGQSNAAGRGFASEVEPIVNDKIKVLRNGRWWKAYTPYNPDRVTAGVNLMESFSDLYSKAHPDVEVGVIPCADGGTSLEQWREGGVLFDHACYMTRLAQRSSTVVGIIWHQGESDSYDEAYPLYEEKLTKIMNALRTTLGLEDVPIIVGGLGDYLANYVCPDISKKYVFVNEALKSFVKNVPLTGFASAEGLTSNPDNLHFSAKSLREFGERYYREFEKLEIKDRVFEKKPLPFNASRGNLESL